MSGSRSLVQWFWIWLKGILADLVFCIGWSAFAYGALVAIKNFLPNAQFHPQWSTSFAVLWVGWPWVLLLCSELLGLFGKTFGKLLGCSLASGLAYAIAMIASRFLPAAHNAGFSNWSFWFIALVFILWPWILLVLSTGLRVMGKSCALPGSSMLHWFENSGTVPRVLHNALGVLMVVMIGICAWISVWPTHEPLVRKGWNAAQDGYNAAVSGSQGLVDGLNRSGAVPAGPSATTSPAGTTSSKRERKLYFEYK